MPLYPLRASHLLVPTPPCAHALVLEGARCNDLQARVPDRGGCEPPYIAARHPEEAERLTDFVSTTGAAARCDGSGRGCLRRDNGIASCGEVIDYGPARCLTFPAHSPDRLLGLVSGFD